jgi:hypothetical protein
MVAHCLKLKNLPPHILSRMFAIIIAMATPLMKMQTLIQNGVLYLRRSILSFIAAPPIGCDFLRVSFHD